MKKFIKKNGISSVNSAESIFGDLLFYQNKLLIPFFNVFIIHDHEYELEPFYGKYIKLCYLVFEDISAITWNYDISRLLSVKNRECYGGEYYINLEHKEFWISYLNGYLILEETFEVSSKPWNYNGISDSFFHISKYTLKNLMKLF
ncbi:hypothetical protein [Leptospira terpstrae]|uniref:hypothetical protein n=1 Tax=Leptospira terpstrae TaxID=293075 RepID=UPI00058699A3|nr:hypothetical protein [Leptospira terpstrae]